MLKILAIINCYVVTRASAAGIVIVVLKETFSYIKKIISGQYFNLALKFMRFSKKNSCTFFHNKFYTIRLKGKNNLISCLIYTHVKNDTTLYVCAIETLNNIQTKAFYEKIGMFLFLLVWFLLGMSVSFYQQKMLNKHQKCPFGNIVKYLPLVLFLSFTTSFTFFLGNAEGHDDEVQTFFGYGNHWHSKTDCVFYTEELKKNQKLLESLEKIYFEPLILKEEEHDSFYDGVRENKQILKEVLSAQNISSTETNVNIVEASSENKQNLNEASPAQNIPSAETNVNIVEASPENKQNLEVMSSAQNIPDPQKKA